MANEMRWDTSQLEAGLVEYGRKVHEAVVAVCKYWEPIIEAEARRGAIWVDRTSNARQGLTAFTQELSKDIVRLYLAHSVTYGIYLFRGQIRRALCHHLAYPASPY